MCLLICTAGIKYCSADKPNQVSTDASSFAPNVNVILSVAEPSLYSASSPLTSAAETPDIAKPLIADTTSAI